MTTALHLKPHPAPSAADSAQDSVRMLKVLLANLDGMVYRRRLDLDLTIESVSSGCTRVTGHQPSDLVFSQRVAYSELVVAEDRLWVREAIRCAVDELRSFDLEYRIAHADGSTRWVWERGAGVLGDHGKPVAIEGLIQDITKRKNAEHALREAERRYHGLFDNAIEGIFLTTLEGRFLDANPALAHIYGFDSPEELIATLSDIGQQLYVDRQRRDEFIQTIKARGSVTGFESQVYRRDGAVIWISENARAVCDENGKPVAYEGTVEDITERRLHQVRIEHQANYDTLTGLANRSLLQDRLQQALLTTARSEQRIAVAFVDLDRFKFINDRLGHHMGDDLLKSVATRLKACVRECDTVARLGGDEFVLLINGHTGPDSVRQMMERILASISQPWVIEQGEFHVSCSIGVALHPEDGDDALTLLKHADSAMYRAKESGRNNVQLFPRELNAVMAERIELETHLRRALERNQFILRYQPRVNLVTGQVVGAEALLRWRIPERGTIPPRRFIGLAEETGLIVPIGKWVLEAACAQNKAWQDAGLPPIVVSVNVSPRQFRHESLVETVAGALRSSGLDARYLELELTESMVMHDAPQLVAMLDDLKRLGVQISVDDFGTGYSSLSYLKRFPVDRLKVDRSFVVHMTSDADDATIVRAIIALGHNLGIKVVAEGVETDKQARALRAYQCDEAQGFLFARAISARDLQRMLTQSKSSQRR